MIDCGVFCSLAVWMGIRYYLGDTRFNQVFRYTPFFITGNDKYINSGALDPFLLKFATHDSAAPSPLELLYIKNDHRYKLKHPAGFSPGENVLHFKASYIIFGPQHSQTVFENTKAIESFLREAYNLPQDRHDQDLLAHAREWANKIDPVSGRSFHQILHDAETYHNHSISQEEWEKHAHDNMSGSMLINDKLVFDYTKFTQWLEQMEKTDTFSQSEYDYKQAAHFETMPPQILQFLPLDHASISFFQCRFPDKIRNIGQKFCQAVENNQPYLLHLHTKEDETKMAIACFKELKIRGKQLLWIPGLCRFNETPEQFQALVETERSIVEQINTISKANLDISAAEIIKDPSRYFKDSEYDNFIEFQQVMRACRASLKLLLHDGVHAVFVQDHSVHQWSYLGQILIEELYCWYASNANKILCILSDKPYVISKQYGKNLVDGTYDFFPYLSYDSPAYQNIYIQEDCEIDEKPKADTSSTRCTMM